MRTTLLAAVAVATFVSPALAGKDEDETARSVIKARGAPCGEVIESATNGDNIVFRCSNGRVYAAIRSGTGYVLGKRDTPNGDWVPY
jgi:hypothetical protein